METHQQSDSDHPKDAVKRAAMVARLLDLIERTNAAVDRHTHQPQPDRLAIRQYTELRDDYVREFAELV